MKILGLIEITMASDLRQLLDERKAYKQHLRYLSGYDYAAGKMLRGADPEDVDAEVSAYDRGNQFDIGVQQAVVDFMNRLPRVRMSVVPQPESTLLKQGDEFA